MVGRQGDLTKPIYFKLIMNLFDVLPEFQDSAG